jgi:hypothetical protein
MASRQLIKTTTSAIEERASLIDRFQVFTGFDGFVDRIQRVVKTRQQELVTTFPTLSELSVRIAELAGKSGQLELISQELKLGGNAPIMSSALGNLGIGNYCVAALGYPEMMPVFKSLPAKIQPVPIAGPGLTNALEFNDGKLILSELTELDLLSWESLLERAGQENLVQMIGNCQLMALVDWSNLRNGTALWQGIREKILPLVSKAPETYFFDIADPSKKSRQEMLEMLHVLSGYRNYGKVVLGINENEANQLHRMIFQKEDLQTPLHDKSWEIFDFLSIDMLVVHPVDRCLTIDVNGLKEITGRLVSKPKLSTGGGDHFNAGFCLGMLLGLDPEQTMLTGMATSGYYVSQGKSPELSGMLEYLKTWN